MLNDNHLTKFAKIAVSLAFCAACAAAASSPQWTLSRTFKLGGEGGWDYLTFDAAGGRIFISRGTKVQVVDPKTGAVLGEIPDTTGVHGIALAPDLGEGFTSNGRAGSVTIFDLKTLKTTATVKISGENPDAIAYDPATKRVLTFNGRTKNASIVDPNKGSETATVALDGKPEFAAADGRGAVFVNIEDKSEIQAIDVRSAKVTATWPLPGCEEPAGLSMDRKNRRLFAGCHNKTLAVVDPDTGKVVASLPIGQGNDATAFDPQHDLVFASNGDGTLTVIREKSANDFVLQENVRTERGARTLAVDPATDAVYLPCADFTEGAPGPNGRPRRQILPGTFRLLVLKLR